MGRNTTFKNWQNLGSRERWQNLKSGLKKSESLRESLHRETLRVESGQAFRSEPRRPGWEVPPPWEEEGLYGARGNHWARPTLQVLEERPQMLRLQGLVNQGAECRVPVLAPSRLISRHDEVCPEAPEARGLGSIIAQWKVYRVIFPLTWGSPHTMKCIDS